MDDTLLTKLDAFSLDDEQAGFKYSHRLARENRWSSAYTERVIAEYKRFIYLCCEAGHPVTPSADVDQAWHLHLCYTRSYWHDLCRDTLGKPIHHGPTKGGKDEHHKFTDWYTKTLQSYEKAFGQCPPTDIWPEPSLRFSSNDIKNIDLSKNLVISKKSVVFASVASVLSLSLIGCTSSDANMPLFIAFVILIIIIGIKFGKGGGKGGNGCGGTGGGCGGSGGGCGGCGGCGG